MNTDELFIDGHKLPKPLSKQEVYELLDKIKKGDEKARAKLIEHNIKLVLYRVTGKFSTVDYDKKELVSIGNFGLVKAITTFDISKNVEFATYAIRCIDNEILMFIRKLKKYEIVDSLDRIFNYDKDGNELKIEDIISDDKDFTEEYTNNEIHSSIRKIVENLPERDRKIVMLHFGFYNDKIYTQEEIAKMLSISQSYTSRLISRIVKRIGKQLEEKGYIELRTKEKSKEKEGDNKMGRKLQTIYEYFSKYTKEQVNEMLEKLSEDDRALITLRYGEDLNNPVSGKLNKQQSKKFYSGLVPKMKRLLENPNNKRKPRKKRTVVPKVVTNDLDESSHSEYTVKETSTQQIIPSGGEIIKQQEEETISESSTVESMTKEDCFKILEMLRTPSFNQMMSVLSVKESVIISLKLGYIDGKYFSTDSIAKFLGIEKQEVLDTTRKVLLLYKENINQFIDSAIQIVTECPKTSSSPVNKLSHK